MWPLYRSSASHSGLHTLPAGSVNEQLPAHLPRHPSLRLVPHPTIFLQGTPRLPYLTLNSSSPRSCSSGPLSQDSWSPPSPASSTQTSSGPVFPASHPNNSQRSPSLAPAGASASFPWPPHSPAPQPPVKTCCSSTSGPRFQEKATSGLRLEACNTSDPTVCQALLQTFDTDYSLNPHRSPEIGSINHIILQMKKQGRSGWIRKTSSTNLRG